MPLELVELVVAIPRKAGGNLQLRGKVMWCQPCGEGWYLSGVRFLDRCVDDCPLA